MKLKRMSALLLAFAMLFTLAACKNTEEKPSQSVESAAPVVSETPTAQPSAAPSAEPEGSEEPSAPVTERTEVNLAVLSGPTGVGAAKLLADSDAGLTANDYNYIIATENSELMAGLNNGDIDIATVASNVAATLYNKTEGVKIIALGTLGVLHILEGGGTSTLNSMTDLMGQTIYAPGQGANPEYILRYLLIQNGLDPDNDVNIVFADASEIQAKLLSGDIQYAMLPVPAATAAIIKGQGSVRAAIDVTEAWNELDNGSSLIMTAVVARVDFIAENPEAVQAFLTEYAASIDYVNNNVDAAAELIAGFGITPSAAIARQAIPQCHLTYIAGAEMAPAISDYFMTLFELSPSSIGGFVPDDGIYYVP